MKEQRKQRQKQQRKRRGGPEMNRLLAVSGRISEQLVGQGHVTQGETEAAFATLAARENRETAVADDAPAGPLRNGNTAGDGTGPDAGTLGEPSTVYDLLRKQSPKRVSEEMDLDGRDVGAGDEDRTSTST